MTDISSLIQRVEGLSGRNYALAAEIWHVVTGEPVAERPTLKTEWCRLYGAEMPYILGSIDAALSLVERMLPGWHVQMNTGDHDRGHHHKPWAKVVPNLNNDAGWLVGAHEGRAATQPAALILALLRALHQGGENA